MYWNVTALTKMGSIIQQVLKGSRYEVLEQLKINGLDLISIKPDMKTSLEHIFKNGRLPAAVLATFFKDFSRALKSGLSAQEALSSLNEQTTQPLLKETLRKLGISIIDGRSFKEAFEGTNVFPLLVTTSLDAAERSGNLVEVTSILSDYFQFMNENTLRLVKSLIYPACVFIALTVASIVISINLVPQLGVILPAGAQDNLSTQFILNYAGFMKAYWCLVLMVAVVLVLVMIRIWELKRSALMKIILGLPFVGRLIKERELTLLFLNLYVYQKSGVNIIASMTYLHTHYPNFVTNRLIDIKNKVNQGFSFGEALKTDGFFPSLIYMNVKKGEMTGNLYQYFYEIYQYYDHTSRDSIESLISIINPALLTIAVSYLGVIIGCFILPLYSAMSGSAIR